MHEVLYRLIARDPRRHVLADQSWARSALGSAFCPKCHRVLRSRFPDPVDVVLRYIPRRLSIGIVSDPYIGIMHERMKECLQEWLYGFTFGRCFQPGGTHRNEYCVFYCRESIVANGGPGSRDDVCLVCGSVWILWDGPGHILRSQLDERHLYQDALGKMYVSPIVYSRIDWTNFPDIEPVVFPVRDAPPEV